uniref:Armadillo repeat-containing protein 1 n=2 Tax=Cacopsylla melanoneura TaxID=428564 RepID=A0A8D9A4D0_9HEMI
MASLDEYQEMAKDWNKHTEMLKDQSCMDFLVYSLDTDDATVLEKTLDILKLFIENEKSHSMLKSYMSLIENIRLIDKRNNISSDLKLLAKDLHSRLYNVSSHTPQSPKKSPFTAVQNSYVFHIEGLYSQNEIDLERAVIRLRGVLSVQIDVEHQRCVVRTMPSVDQIKIAQQIVDTTRMKPRLVSKNKNQQEIFIDILNANKGDTNSEDELSDEDLPAYLPEEDDEEESYHPKSILSFQYIRDNASTLIHSAARIINSFYC